MLFRSVGHGGRVEGHGGGDGARLELQAVRAQVEEGGAGGEVLARGGAGERGEGGGRDSGQVAGEMGVKGNLS